MKKYRIKMPNRRDNVIEVEEGKVVGATIYYEWMHGQCLGSIREWVKINFGTIKREKNE